ncbi:MAG: hypothetical protein N2645_18395 [Clostridia bacterium]|nr:hypothetical protein [Clostridia bacterium]
MVIFQKLKLFVQQGLFYVFWRIVDIIIYYRDRLYLNFDGFGLHIYCGMFGSGKTSTMVRDAYMTAKRYPQVTILTNMKLFFNDPQKTILSEIVRFLNDKLPEKYTPYVKFGLLPLMFYKPGLNNNILPLTDYKDIVTSPPNTLILLDELSSVFNSRDWKKQGIPAPLLGVLLQVRKERKMLMATAQRFIHVDALLRQITFTVRVCSCMAGRWNWVNVYDGWEYENQNPVKPATLLRLYAFIQGNSIRNLYDTYEMVQKIKTAEYMTDEEILEKQGAGSVNNVTVMVQEGKKKRKKLL